jgi:hypothetical protein
MATKIQRLTTTQTRDLAETREAWRALESSTVPADRGLAEVGVREAYRASGRPGPSTILWAEDPAVGAAIAATLAQSFDRVAQRLWWERRAEAKREALKSFQGRVWAEIRDGARFEDRGAAEAEAEAEAVVAVRGLLLHRDKGGASGVFGRRNRNGSPDWGSRDLWGHGPHDQRERGFALAREAAGPRRPSGAPFSEPDPDTLGAVLGWAFGNRAQRRELAVYDAYARVSHHTCDPFAGLVETARSAGWWWPFRDVAVVCERPMAYRTDREGRLHADDGPALAYRNGFSAYMWHGRPVPRWVVHRPTVDRIGAEQNVEVRRCAIESLGWSRFAEEAGLRQVDACPDPGNPGERLTLHDVPRKVWGRAVRVLICVNGTEDLDGGRHTFGLLVPAGMDSAMGAAAWGYGLTAEEYATLQRRA